MTDYVKLIHDFRQSEFGTDLMKIVIANEVDTICETSEDFNVICDYIYNVYLFDSDTIDLSCMVCAINEMLSNKEITIQDLINDEYELAEKILDLAYEIERA